MQWTGGSAGFTLKSGATGVISFRVFECERVHMRACDRESERERSEGFERKQDACRGAGRYLGEEWVDRCVLVSVHIHLCETDRHRARAGTE